MPAPLLPPPANYLRSIAPSLAIGVLLAGYNPFAFGLAAVLPAPQQALSNPATVHNFFSRFRNAYQLRDSALYSELLDRRFTFTFRDVEAKADRTWNRDVEMATTAKLFRAARPTLHWTHYLPTSDTLLSDTLVYVDRAYQLSIAQHNSQPIQSAGTTRLVLVRKQKGDLWRIRSWHDQSEF